MGQTFRCHHVDRRDEAAPVGLVRFLQQVQGQNSREAGSAGSQINNMQRPMPADMLFLFLFLSPLKLGYQRHRFGQFLAQVNASVDAVE